jgi:hypothetical protein
MAYLMMVATVLITKCHMMILLVNNKFGGMWMQGVITSFKVLSCHFPVGTRKPYKPVSKPTLEPETPLISHKGELTT